MTRVRRVIACAVHRLTSPIRSGETDSGALVRKCSGGEVILRAFEREDVNVKAVVRCILYTNKSGGLTTLGTGYGRKLSRQDRGFTHLNSTPV